LTRGLQTQGGGGARSNEALVSLVESIQHMVKHMRSEQDITRQQLKQQQTQQEETKVLMRKLSAFFDKAAED